MMLFRNLIILSLAAMFWTSCRSTQNTAEGSREVVPAHAHFLVGSGGGITGAYTQYKIFSDGDVQALDLESQDYEPRGSLSHETTQELFSSLENLRLEEYAFEHPGNMTYFLGLEPQKETHWIKWGDPNYPVREDVKGFFDQAMEAIRSLD